MSEDLRQINLAYYWEERALKAEAEVERLRELILDWWEATPDDVAATYAAGLGLAAEAKRIRALRGEGEK